MKITNTLWYIVTTILIILTGIFLIIGIIMVQIANKQCGDKCQEMGGVIYEVYESGNLKIDDTCVCYGWTWVNVFKLNG